jgi:hypothetical protein
VSHNYSVISCVYNGTTGGSGDPNPICYLRGTCDGVVVGFVAVYYDLIMQASLSGGVAGVQKILGPVLLGAAPTPAPQPYPQEPTPWYSTSVSPAPRGSGDISVAAALVPPWSA